MTPVELIERYQDAMSTVIGFRPDIQYRYGRFYRVEKDGLKPMQRSTLERISAAWGKA